MFGHHKHVFLIGIHDIGALVLREKFFPFFALETKFIHQIKQMQKLIILSILFVIGHFKYVLLIWIHGIDAWVLEEKLFFPPFSIKSKFIHPKNQTRILIIMSIPHIIEHYEHILLFGIHNIYAFVSQDIFFPPFS